jgi:predicted ATPase
LAERLGDDERLRRVLWGQCTVEHNRCDLGAAQRTAEELVRRGQARGDLRASTFGYRSMGCVLAHAASFEEARRALEKVAEVGARAGPAAFTDHVYDPVVTSRAYLARCLLHAGYPDEHERVLARALADTAASGHAPALGYVLFQAAELGVEGRDPRAARVNVEYLIPLAREHGFTLWLAMAEAIEGWVAAEKGEPVDASVKVRRGLSVYEAHGVVLMQPFLLAMLGAVLGRAGRPDEALQALETGVRLVEDKGEAIWAPELHRLRGEMLLALSRHAEAETSYARSLDIARAQAAKLAELRAATSLARLWARQDRRQPAVDLLAPVYAWFTEGFDTPDLQEAQALLDELR